MRENYIKDFKRGKIGGTHILTAAIITAGIILGWILDVLLSEVRYTIWITVGAFVIAALFAVAVVRLGGGLIASLTAGLSITVAAIHTSWTPGIHSGNNAIQSLYMFIWVAWQYMVVFLPAAAIGFLAGATWVAGTIGERNRNWILSRAFAVLILILVVWVVWFYWFDAQSLLRPGPPPV